MKKVELRVKMKKVHNMTRKIEMKSWNYVSYSKNL